MTGDRTVIRVENKKIDPHYALYALRNMKVMHGFGHTHKAVPKNLDRVFLDVPVTDEGNWDIEAQQQIARRYHHILKLQESLSRRTEDLSAYDVEID